MPDISKRLEKAEKYLQKGKMQDALEEFLAAVEEDPENNAVRERAADLSISLNQNKEAGELLSVLYDRLGTADQAKAVVTYKKLARMTTPRVEQTFRYAQFIEKNNKKEALELYQKSAEGFVAAGKKDDALDAYKRLVALDASLENLKAEGELAASLGEGKTAASAFFRAGELEKAANRDGHGWYDRAYKLDGTNMDAALAYAQSLLRRGDGAGALKVSEPLATKPECDDAITEVYGRALLALKRPADAEPVIWKLYQRDPKRIGEVCGLISTLIDVEEYERALELANKAGDVEAKQGRQRDYVSLLKEVVDKHPPGTEFLEYMVGMFNATNREHDYCDALVKLFQLYYAAGNFLKAGDCLDAAAEVDPYEKGHQKRLELLKGKIDPNRYRAIANRFTAALRTSGQVIEEDVKPAADSEPTVLEDFMLQAEIFLQYSMRSKAVERLERIQKLFPHEEERNEKLRSLYMSAGMMPKYEPGAAPPAPAPVTAPAPAPAAPVATAPAAPAPAVAGIQPVPQAMANENAVDNISRVTEITRNIYRQANVKAVLFAAVNDVGRHWNASRCVAGLCTPGKPPSAALEYCAPGVKQSEVMALVKLIGTLQGLAVGQGPVAIPNVKNAPELAPIKLFIDALEIESVLAVPLVDGDEHVCILILEQCDAPRSWRQTDVLVLKTIADQMVLAVNNAKLRNLMKTLAVTDEKSGLLKRSSYVDVLLSEVRRGLQQSSQASVMLLHFGKASTLVREIGEPAVETMMQSIGQICCSHIRQNDVAVRYDLTTIALILADTSDKNAFFVVDKMRKVLASIKVPGTDRQVPCAVGIAEAVMQVRFDPVDIVTEVVNRVESALETAKHEGPNSAQSLAPVLETAAVA
ncbi:MAG TPA: diguanylate cyclase [Terriglobales bacterium]|nr:diguanylate cyclase [Terriglobales bacterium]